MSIDDPTVQGDYKFSQPLLKMRERIDPVHSVHYDD